MRAGKTVLFLAVSVFILSGCATGRRQNEMEAQGLRNQVSLLESQIQSRDSEINALTEELSKCNQEMSLGKSISKKEEVKSRPRPKQIQTALANAGYNPGPIDGRIGAQTRQAIKAFQKDNDLPQDGRVGKKTWALLRKYLNRKVK